MKPTPCGKVENRPLWVQKFLQKNNAEMVFEAKGTKREMHQWQHRKIVEHKEEHGGSRPPLNKSDY